MQIRLGHSPDADDAFMFWALASGRVDRARLRVRARAARHPDAERVGSRGPAGDDCHLAARVPVRSGPLRAAAARREHGRRLRPHRRGAGAARAGGPRGPRDRRAWPYDDGVPRPPHGDRRLPLPRGAVRPDPRRGEGGRCRRRARHPRGSADLRGRGPREGARPRGVVAAGDRTAAAARRQRRPARSR